MPHVSRHAPTKTIADKTLDLFMECVTAKWSPFDRRMFFDDLLTPTERIMFSKRLAIIYMLGKGYTFEHIQETLRVSPSTIARIWKEIEHGKYTNILERMNKKVESSPDLFAWLVNLLPPMHQTRKQYADRLKTLKH